MAIKCHCRSRWPCGLGHELYSLARTLGSWVRFPFKAWMFVCAFILCLCCPCDGLITSPRSPTVCVLFFIIIPSGVILESTWYCGHYWHIVPAPGDRWWWLWSNWWNENWQGKSKSSEKTCPSATLSTTNPTWPGPGLNPGRRGGKPATNRLSYGAALVVALNVNTEPSSFSVSTWNWVWNYQCYLDMP
jgi:hypothetical protein